MARATPEEQERLNAAHATADSLHKRWFLFDLGGRRIALPTLVAATLGLLVWDFGADQSIDAPNLHIAMGTLATVIGVFSLYSWSKQKQTREAAENTNKAMWKGVFGEEVKS